jgi:hypothetical protein
MVAAKIPYSTKTAKVAAMNTRLSQVICSQPSGVPAGPRRGLRGPETAAATSDLYPAR